MKKLFLALFCFLLSIPAFAVQATSVRTVYSGTPVTTGAWVTLVAAVTYPVRKMSIFDSSGQTMQIGVFSPGGVLETSILLPPGGGDYILGVNQGWNVSIRAVSGTASTGENDLDLFY